MASATEHNARTFYRLDQAEARFEVYAPAILAFFRKPPPAEVIRLDDPLDEDILELGSGPFAVEIDLMQPLDPDKRPRVHEPALNHIGLWVDDDVRAAGVRLVP